MLERTSRLFDLHVDLSVSVCFALWLCNQQVLDDAIRTPSANRRWGWVCRSCSCGDMHWLYPLPRCYKERIHDSTNALSAQQLHFRPRQREPAEPWHQLLSQICTSKVCVASEMEAPQKRTQYFGLTTKTGRLKETHCEVQARIGLKVWRRKFALEVSSRVVNIAQASTLLAQQIFRFISLDCCISYGYSSFFSSRSVNLGIKWNDAIPLQAIVTFIHPCEYFLLASFSPA